MLLRSLQDIMPADLLEAELSDTGMEDFSFDDQQHNGMPDVQPASGTSGSAPYSIHML